MSMSASMSEEAIRTQIVFPVLVDLGFAPSEISIEYGFEIKVGRGVYRVGGADKPITTLHPRADILVRHEDGRNLFIIELKAPQEPLDEIVLQQGLSYARLLKEGGIAPFVVLTNGRETRIYDSITGERIDGKQIPSWHPYVSAGFRISLEDEISLRTETLERFVCLSAANLLVFCEAQITHRMRLLRDGDLLSGKKYIPSLYIERRGPAIHLAKLIDKGEKTIVVVGAPQVGKTNFLCHEIEQRIAAGTPCLFYPAISLDQGLLAALRDDFQWLVNENSPLHVVARKLVHILDRLHKKLIIFIDGWNEADASLARMIDRESEYLDNRVITFVVSFTDVSSRRLLTDDKDNPSYFAETARINKFQIPRLEIEARGVADDARTNGESIVFIDRYDSEELEIAYSTYITAYNVEVPEEHEYVNDPFILRLGMEFYQNGRLPRRFDEINLVGHSLKSKARRVKGISVDETTVVLQQLADTMFVHGAPISLSTVANSVGRRELVESMFDAALLTRTRNVFDSPSVDFYYGRERSYAVACWSRDWIKQTTQASSLLRELSEAEKTNVGIETARWFFSQPKNASSLKLLAEQYTLLSSIIRRILISCIWTVFSEMEDDETRWIIDLLKVASKDSDPLIKADIAKLTVVALEDVDSEELSESFILSIEFVTSLLTIDKAYPLKKESVSFLVLDALQRLHWNSSFGSDESEATEILVSLWDDPQKVVRDAAIKALGYVSPHVFLREASRRLKSEDLSNATYKAALVAALDLATGELNEMSYGSMCPGYFDTLEEDAEQIEIEYERFYDISKRVVQLFWGNKAIDGIKGLLDTFQEFSERWPISSYQSTPRSLDFVHPDQLSLPFDYDE